MINVKEKYTLIYNNVNINSIGAYVSAYPVIDRQEQKYVKTKAPISMDGDVYITNGTRPDVRITVQMICGKDDEQNLIALLTTRTASNTLQLQEYPDKVIDVKIVEVTNVERVLEDGVTVTAEFVCDPYILEKYEYIVYPTNDSIGETSQITFDFAEYDGEPTDISIVADITIVKTGTSSASVPAIIFTVGDGILYMQGLNSEFPLSAKVTVNTDGVYGSFRSSYNPYKMFGEVEKLKLVSGVSKITIKTESNMSIRLSSRTKAYVRFRRRWLI